MVKQHWIDKHIVHDSNVKIFKQVVPVPSEWDAAYKLAGTSVMKLGESFADKRWGVSYMEGRTPYPLMYLPNYFNELEFYLYEKTMGKFNVFMDHEGLKCIFHLGDVLNEDFGKQVIEPWMLRWRSRNPDATYSEKQHRYHITKQKDTAPPHTIYQQDNLWAVVPFSKRELILVEKPVDAATT